MFNKVLIANRGEIALRIARTLRDMQIASVAVFSDADARSPVVRAADEAVRLGPASAAESYLNAERLIAAAKQTGCDAVIPGYGFLSENAHFARAVLAAGLVFIGPSPQVIADFGSKLEARRLVSAAGVPVVPGGHISSVAQGQQLARDLGYPVLLKAAFGGGGKGMRLVSNPDEFESAFRLAGSEAARAFGSDVVYLEKAIERPRHIEVQIIGDQHGHLVHLGERECSVQRRHQKVLEETPAPGLSAAAREHMTKVALAAAKSVGYYSAGTFEFLLDQAENFYFLEVNTRLQVEHTVTELVTGLDIVELMVRVAAGEALGFTQEDVRAVGAAIQARIYAEDATRGFMPTGGKVQWLKQAAGPFVRFDHALETGLCITNHYDPMLGKLCAWGRDRPQALARLERALSETHIAGVTNNTEFLADILRTPEFSSGKYNTSLLAAWEHALPGSRIGARQASPEELAAIAVAAELAAAATSVAAAQPEISEWVRAQRSKLHG